MFTERHPSQERRDNSLRPTISSIFQKNKGGAFDPHLPPLEMNHVGIFGKKAQALIGGYDYHTLKNITEHKAFTNLKDFQDSKPSANGKVIKIYSYRTHLRGNLSNYECVWYKLKSPDVIDHVQSIPKIKNPVSPEKILELAFQEAKKMVPSAAKRVEASGYQFIFESEHLKTGFQWINSDMKIKFEQNKKIRLKTPTLITNRLVPIFGGMTYCKVFTPHDAAKFLIELANGS